MSITPRAQHRRHAPLGLAVALLALTASACATPGWRSSSTPPDDTLAPLEGTLPPTPVGVAEGAAGASGEPLQASEPPVPGGATAPADPLTGRADPAARTLLQTYFPTLDTLLHRTSLGRRTSGTGFTLLAPSETAFAHMPGDYVRNLTADPADADHVLARHILLGAYTYAQLATMKTVTTLDGDVLDVSVGWDGSVLVDGARVMPAVGPEPTDPSGVAVFPVERVLVDQL